MSSQTLNNLPRYLTLHPCSGSAIRATQFQVVRLRSHGLGTANRHARTARIVQARL
jgi:hypothetical protein